MPTQDSVGSEVKLGMRCGCAVYRTSEHEVLWEERF